MEQNLLIEQYSRYKKSALEHSPFKFLLEANIEPNPHQINAFCAAIQALKTGGIVLADEVGLGKTIEAGLVLKYLIEMGAKRILIALPATLRKQWEIELDEKFGIKASILDRQSVERDIHNVREWITNLSKTQIVLTSYDYASKLIKRFPMVKWDYIFIDEAHNLRNVFHGTKRAKNLYDRTKGIPKVLLTATPLQNSLSDLYGLISFIDPKIFGSERVFNRRFIEREDYQELKRELRPVLYRTLRKDVAKYMAFKKRECVTVDFGLSDEEKNLYDLVNRFLKRQTLYSIPVTNRGLVILVIRKLLASSSFALVQTFEVLKERLKKLYQGTKSANAQEGFDLFWDFVQDEMEESDQDEDEEKEVALQKQEIQDELSEVQRIIDVASRIKSNAKIDALKIAIRNAFRQQTEKDIQQKVVVFTESKRTQKYIAEELRKEGYQDEDIILFNGDFDDIMSKKIFHAWQVKNFSNANYGRGVEYKHAIVDYFKTHAKILIVTDVGSEGLNLQFCNTVINYDLPWNPQKIEQRIGRCHRYGQEHDVVAINLLNTDNAADRRVYEILSKKFSLFSGVFGASDVALGVLESGVGFEKRILEIYQNCDTENDFNKAFDTLNRQLFSKKNSRIEQLQSILMTESAESKGKALEKTRLEIEQYMRDVKFWSQFDEPEMDGKLYYWRIDNWGEEVFGEHGTLFIGAFLDNTKTLFPALLLCDKDGNHIEFEEQELIDALKNAKDEDIHYYTPTKEEQESFGNMYDCLIEDMKARYAHSVEPVMEYHRNKVANWSDIQIEQLMMEIADLTSEVEGLLYREAMARDFLEKSDILKLVKKKRDQLDKAKKDLPRNVEKIKEEEKKDVLSFEEQLKINPILLINIVLKF